MGTVTPTAPPAARPTVLMVMPTFMATVLPTGSERAA